MRRFSFRTLSALFTLAAAAASAEAASVDIIWHASGTAITAWRASDYRTADIVITPTTPLIGGGLGSYIELSADTDGGVSLVDWSLAPPAGWLGLGYPVLGNPHTEDVVKIGDLRPGEAGATIAGPTVLGTITVHAEWPGTVTVSASGPADAIDSAAASVLAEYRFNPGIVVYHELVEPIPEPISWVTVGAGGEACDAQTAGCFGAVAYEYRIGSFEVTNSQYAEFLNAVAASDPHALYNTNMAAGYGGIVRIGDPGRFEYGVEAGREHMPVNYVSFWDAARFANWLHQGRPTGLQDVSTTEDGAYTLTPSGIANNTVTRNAGARVFVTSEDEWTRAAYFDGTRYRSYPAGSDSQMVCTAPGATANTANCDGVHGDLSVVGSYTGAASPVGTFDQGGNVSEWNDTIVAGSKRVGRGGSFLFGAELLSLDQRFDTEPSSETEGMGFRVASSVPAPAERSAGRLGPAILPFAFGACLIAFAAVRIGRAWR